MTAPITETYLAKAERDARRLKGPLAPYVLRLAAEVRSLQVPPPPPALVGMINRQTEAMLAGKNPASDRHLFTVQDPYSPTFVRNRSCWLSGVRNLTCCSPAQLSGATWSQRAGTLVTKRHIIYANHFGIPIIDGGTPVLFVRTDNTVVQRRLVAQASDAGSDIAIGLLDADVPEGIEIAPVLPADFEKHLGSRNATLSVVVDAEEKANVQVCDTFWSGQYSTNMLSANWMPAEWKQLSAWGENIIAGDSGSPAFLLICNELVLLGCFWTAMGGPHVGARAELVNRLINQLSPGYSLTVKAL